MTTERRKKLSDIEAQRPFRGAAFPLSETLAKVETLRVEVRPTVKGRPIISFGNHEWIELYNEKTIVEILNCRNPSCYGGGLDLANLLWNVVNKKKAEDETSISCAGEERSPKGRRYHRPCDTRFSVKINVTYKEQ